jgi:DNA-binding NtrC family response regulator
MPGLPFDWRRARSLRILEEALTRFLVANNANEIAQIRDPDKIAEAVALEAAMTTERERLRLLATARGMTHLAKAQEVRKAQMAERSTKNCEVKLAQARRALSETRGNRSGATRLLGWSKSALDRYARMIAAEDAAKPVERCPLCASPLVPLDKSPPRP